MDFGSGSQANFTALEIPHQDITAYFATHLHADHVADFPQVWVGSWFGGRVKPNARLASGQVVRLPPVRFDAVPKPRLDSADAKVVAELKAMTLYEDDDMMVLNKPMGLAVQGGIGMTKHIDGMLESLRTDDGQKPRLVHRIDKDTAGCLLIAKTRFAATELMSAPDAQVSGDAYRAYRAALHRAALQDEPARVPDSEFREYRAAVMRIWRELFEENNKG